MVRRKPSDTVLDSVGKGSVDLTEVATHITYIEKLASKLSTQPAGEKQVREKTAERVLPRNSDSVEKVTNLVEQLKSLGSAR